MVHCTGQAQQRREFVVLFGRHCGHLVAQSQVQSEIAQNVPVILRIRNYLVKGRSVLSPDCNKDALKYFYRKFSVFKLERWLVLLKDPTLGRFVPLLVALLAATAFGQPSVPGQQAKDAWQTAQVAKFFIAEPAAGSGYETGPLQHLQ
jgi:hypothetical protein